MTRSGDMNAHIERAAITPKPPLPSARDDDAILANPRGQSEKQRQRMAEIQDRLDREAAIQVCDQVILEGCGGAPAGDNPEGCTSPDHAEHVASAVFLWRMIGLCDPGEIAAKFGEAS